MRLTPFLFLVILAFPLSGQEKPASAVENLVHDYCGDDPYVVARAKNPNQLFAPRDAQKDPYLRCREMVIAKAQDTRLVEIKEENERLRKALQSICVLPDNRMAIRNACAALSQPKPVLY
jgi:hypothetical protein